VASFKDLYEEPSILGAMQFCRYFTTNAGLALLHTATGADKQQQRLARSSSSSSSSSTASTQQDLACQQQLLTPFTLVVDAKGTGHVATLQAALDMAAVAAGQRAQQHYSSSTSSDHVPANATQGNSSSATTCKRRSSVELRPAAADAATASDADVQTSSNGGSSSSSTCDSAAACDNLLIVLLPGTYPGSYALPGSIRHITIAGISGCRTLLCEAGNNQPCTDSTTTNSSTKFLQQQQQHSLQELDARMLRLQLAHRQAAAASPGQLLRSCSASTAQQQLGQQQQGPAAACLLSCPFGVESLKLQHLHMELAGASGKQGAAQCQRVLMRQESAPASIGAVRGTGGFGTSRLGCSSSSKGGCGEAGGVGVSDDGPYCIRLCAGSELRMEWCEFSGGAGGVLSEAGAMVAAMQCSFQL
jgi:hypothetical protein